MNRALVFGNLLLVVSAAFGCDDDPRHRVAGAGTERLASCAGACRGACATSVGAERSHAVAEGSELMDCLSSCSAECSAATAMGCAAELHRYLLCAGLGQQEASRAYAPQGIGAPWQTPGRACRAAHEALRACQAPCRARGTVHLAERTLPTAVWARREPKAAGKDKGEISLSVEVEDQGCQGCGLTVRSGAPPGSPCQAASVCAAECCRCDDERVAFTARVCLDGRCVGEHRGCELLGKALPELGGCVQRRKSSTSIP